jgi:hypothetical protein
MGFWDTILGLPLLAIVIPVHIGVILSSIKLFYELFSTSLSYSIISQQMWESLLTVLFFLVGTIGCDSVLIKRYKYRICNHHDFEKKEPDNIATERRTIEERDRSLSCQCNCIRYVFRFCLILMAVFNGILYFSPSNNNDDNNSHPNWIKRIDVIVGIFSLLSVIIIIFLSGLYVRSCEELAYMFKILNRRIEELETLIFLRDTPHLKLVKQWYSWNYQRVFEFDCVYNIQAAGYVVLLFSAILVTIRKVVNENNDQWVFVISLLYIIIMIISFFYLLKIASDVSEESKNTLRQLYKFALTAEERSPELDREVK